MLLKLENISKAYGTPGEADYHPVLDALSLELDPGATLAILGPSGSGKSTLLNILGTLDIPGSGTYTYRDRDITGYSGAELDNFRNREIGFVFQFHHLLPQCTVLENVLVPTLMNRQEADAKRAYAESLLQKVGMADHAHKLPGQLSGGECQRVAVVRAMINKPSLLLADEPTGALDKKNVGRLTDLLLQMREEEGAALVLVTHSDALAAGMETVCQLDEGKLHKL
jgi:ABC-type lipoprotein export system ATPase subunit